MLGHIFIPSWGFAILLSAFLLFFTLIGIVQFSMLFYTWLHKPISDGQLYYIIPLQQSYSGTMEAFLRSRYCYTKWNSYGITENIILLAIDASEEDCWIARLFAEEKGLLYLEDPEALRTLCICKNAMTVLY